MAKKKAGLKATRTETITVGETSHAFVAGEVYTDVPEDLVENLSGDYGLLVEPDDEEDADG